MWLKLFAVQEANFQNKPPPHLVVVDRIVLGGLQILVLDRVHDEKVGPPTGAALLGREPHVPGPN